jgi:serine/threonine-protein kinase
MGAVWVARHTKLDVDVALKFMHAHHAGSHMAEARFENEAKAAAQLRCPQVVQIHDYGVHDGTPYMAMELLEGEDLGARLQRSPRLTLEQLATIARSIARALASAHDAGIVHRDLKPSNVFLARQGPEEAVKVLDFGIAKALGPSGSGYETTSGVVLGSPLYMSPEQARGGPLDHRSDLWSFGVLLFEAVTARQPFLGASAGDVIAKICGDPIPKASSVVPSLSRAMDAFFERALAREPAGRFQDAAAMAGAFESAIGDSASVAIAAAAPIGRLDETAPLALQVRGEPEIKADPANTRSGDVPPRSRVAIPVVLVASALIGALAFAAVRHSPAETGATKETATSTSTAAASVLPTTPTALAASSGVASASVAMMPPSSSAATRPSLPPKPPTRPLASASASTPASPPASARAPGSSAPAPAPSPSTDPFFGLHP